MNGQDGPGHGVEASGEYDDIRVERALVGLDAGGRDRLNRLLPEIHQRYVGTVVGGIVVGLEAGTLSPERVVAGDQRCGCLRVLDDRADFLAKLLSYQRVPVDIDALVCPQLAQHEDEVANGPRVFEALAALSIAQLPAEDR